MRISPVKVLIEITIQWLGLFSELKLRKRIIEKLELTGC
jgi:hypothetical protein